MTVDIIIPCYYSAEIIQPCLEKIANQTTINDITVILVNDCSPNTNCEYWDLISKYLSRIHIKYFKTEVNSGPGVARQLGLDNATSDWVMFIDDDDELYDETSVERLLKLADTSTIIAVTGQSIHRSIDTGEETIQKPWIHHHGSIYNRQLLKKINAHYDSRLSYLEEDGGFSRIILYQGKDYQQLKLNEPIYIKKFITHHNSLTTNTTIEQKILSLIGLNVLDIHYKYNAFDNVKLTTVIEQYLVISNLLYYAMNDNNINLDHMQYNTLLSFINELLPFLSEIESFNDSMELLDEILKFYNTHFSFKNYVFSENPLSEFKTQYLEWLRIIFTKLKME